MFWYILLFLVSCGLFYLAGRWVTKGLARIAKYLGLREFVVAFFVMAFAASLPNLAVGISAGLRGIPELSFGDVSGNNLVALTLVVAIAALFSKAGIPAESRMVRTSSYFVMVSALLPLILVLDKNLSRTDGLLLIALFFFYVFWLFSKQERFTRIYDGPERILKPKPKNFTADTFKILLGLIIFVIAAQGIVVSAQFFSKNFRLPLVLIGILITGLASALPELYFNFISARTGENWMALGDLMGAVIIPSTLVLGIVALIYPIYISDFSSLSLARVFIVISALVFPIMVRTKNKISKTEGLFLLFLYIIFLISQIFFYEIISTSGFDFLLK